MSHYDQSRLSVGYLTSFFSVVDWSSCSVCDWPSFCSVCDWSYCSVCDWLSCSVCDWPSFYSKQFACIQLILSMWIGQRLMLLSPLVLETRVTKPGAHHSARLSGQQAPVILLSSPLRWQPWDSSFSFSCGCWDLTSSMHFI